MSSIHEKEQSALTRIARSIEMLDRGDEPKRIRAVLTGALCDLNDNMFPGEEVYPEPVKPRQTEEAA